MLTSSVPVWKQQKKRQSEAERKRASEREKSEKQAFANCRTRDDVAHSSFSCTLQFWCSFSSWSLAHDFA